MVMKVTVQIEYPLSEIFGTRIISDFVLFCILEYLQICINIVRMEPKC